QGPTRLLAGQRLKARFEQPGQSLTADRSGAAQAGQVTDIESDRIDDAAAAHGSDRRPHREVPGIPDGDGLERRGTALDLKQRQILSRISTEDPGGEPPPG